MGFIPIDESEIMPASIGVSGFRPITDDEIAQPTTLDNISGQLGKGAGYGWMNEVEGVESALRNSIASLFGAGNGQSFGDNYEATKQARGAEDRAMEAAHPYLSTALQFGGAILPALASGGAGLLAGTANATGAAGALPATGRFLAKNLYGVGIKEAPTVGQLIKMGITGGALGGAGEMEDNRALGALLGAGTGAVVAPIAGKALETGTNFILDKNAELGISKYLGSKLGEQRGSFSTKPASPSDSNYSTAQLLVAQKLKNTPLETILSGREKLGAALGEGVPLFTPEALDSPSVYRHAQFAANYDPSLEFAQSAINTRTANAPIRAAELFDNVSGERSAFEGANKMIGAAGSILEGAETSRKAAVQPLYDAAYKQTPHIESPELTSLMEKDQILTRAIREVKKTANNADLADNNTGLLVKARNEISNQIDGAKSRGEGRKARDLTDTYNRLNDILHEKNPALGIADAVYSQASGKIQELNDTFLKTLADISGDKVTKVSQVFNMPAERITALRSIFEKSGSLPEWEAGIRSHLQTVLDNAPEGQDFTRKLIGNNAQKQKLQAALGESYDKVVKGLEYEHTMFKGKNKYNAGSSTKGNLEEVQNFRKGVGFIQKMTSGGSKIDAILSLFSSGPSDETARELAKIYFDPNIGKSTLDKIVPLLKQYASNRKISSVASAGSALAADRVAPKVLSKPGQQSTPARSQKLAQELPAILGAKSRVQPSQAQAEQLDQSQQDQSGQVDKASLNSALVDLASQTKSTKPVNFIDKAISKAEDKMAGKTPDAPVVVNAKRVDTTDPIQITKVMEGVFHQESGGKIDAVSKAGAKGLGQLMDATGKELFSKYKDILPVGSDKKYDPFDPVQNKALSTLYMKELLDQFDGDLSLALTAYNQGPGRVKNLLKIHDASSLEEIRPYLGKDGKAYARSIISRLKKQGVIEV